MDPLDRPVWNALTTRQSNFAIGDGRAVRMAAEFGPFGAAADGSAENLTALAALIPENGELWLVEAEPVGTPPDTVVRKQALLVQMVAATITPASGDLDITMLTNADGPEMHALAVLTAPGPSHASTHELGRFVGIRVDGRLVAMAGERMRLAGHIEVSGVCTHPDFRGRGYAAILMRHVAMRIITEGDFPFLHSYASNTGAIMLYEKLGFKVRRTITATVIGRD
ncbi:GNAT family N-acetyltransferase [soil metagenome]